MMTNKIALITGGNGGLGAAMARELAAFGARVVINYIEQPEKAEALRASIQSAGGEAMAVRADISDLAQIEAMFDQIEATWGTVDVLVNNAGIEIRSPALEFREADYVRTLDTNLKGAFFCARRALRGMKERGWGRVINISSVHEIKPTGWSIPYSMSKGGLAMMTREMAFEFSKFGITINGITPGAIRTDINREVLADPAYEAKVLTKIPAGFIGEATDVAALVAFLASDRARYITGASLLIDGGMAL
jgi:glucose 1-dehydrogenase